MKKIKSLITFCFLLITTSFFAQEKFSNEILNNVKKYGAEVPFYRPNYLANDYAGTKEVVDHSIKYLEKSSKKINIVGCFYATSIFAKPNLIRKAFTLLSKKIRFILLA